MELDALMDEGYSTWVRFQDAEVLMAYVTADALRAIRRRATESRWDRVAEPTERVDEAEAARLIGRAAVRGWRGLTLRGAEYEYTPERCDLLMSRWGEFAAFVAETAFSLGRMAEASRAEAVEDASKKSRLTSGPASTTRV